MGSFAWINPVLVTLHTRDGTPVAVNMALVSKVIGENGPSYHGSSEYTALICIGSHPVHVRETVEEIIGLTARESARLITAITHGGG